MRIKVEFENPKEIVKVADYVYDACLSYPDLELFISTIINRADFEEFTQSVKEICEKKLKENEEV